MWSRLIAALAVACGLSVPAHAFIWWTDWSPSFAPGSPGLAQGIVHVNGIQVTYSGQLLDVRFDIPTWAPDPTYNIGVEFVPWTYQGMVALTGGNAMLNTITFSRPIRKPYLAIWSLGQPGLPAEFIFDQLPSDPDAGGPSFEYGGSSITRSGNTIWGEEGNGVIHFEGQYTSISWISPIYEDFYGFTVGIRFRSMPCGMPDPGAEEDGGFPGCAQPPEPLTASIFGTALIGLAILNRRRRRGD